jgi:signal transduction histidine kinase
MAAFFHEKPKSKQEVSVLTNRLLQLQENERRHIARELHDGLNQSMAMLGIEVGMILEQLPKNASSMRPHLNKLRVRVQHLSDEVRRISHQLHPAVLDHLGLVSALNSLCSEFRSYRNLNVLFVCDGAIEKLSFPVSVCLYRITQEALCNAAKHANASEVVVSLILEDKEIKLAISDDGDGFDMTQPRQAPGLGLISMEERARVAGGHFFIDSETGAGTRIEVVVPTQEAWQWNSLKTTSPGK